MPWQECNLMDERLKFIARLLDGVPDHSCREVTAGANHLGGNCRVGPGTFTPSLSQNRT